MNPLSRRETFKTLGLGTAVLAVAPLMAAAAGTRPSAGEMAESEVAFKDGKFVLPPLPYAYDALEPAIDQQTMHLHHDIHHASYVKNGNVALDALAAIAAGSGDASLTGHWDNELAFNGSGTALHTIFWNNMKPKGGATPTGTLADAIKNAFGSQEHFEKVFATTAASVQGSGWAILGFSGLTQRLHAIQAEKHQNQTFQGITPILVLDVWEHAYYLKYQNKRAEYIKAFLTIINYDDVAKRLENAMCK